jgi:hypothetical protein
MIESHRLSDISSISAVPYTPAFVNRTSIVPKASSAASATDRQPAAGRCRMRPWQHDRHHRVSNRRGQTLRVEYANNNNTRTPLQKELRRRKAEAREPRQSRRRSDQPDSYSARGPFTPPSTRVFHAAILMCARGMCDLRASGSWWSGLAARPTKPATRLTCPPTLGAGPSSLERGSYSERRTARSVRPWCDLVSPEPATRSVNKPLICSGFFKPSDGLEPSTPSLPCAPNGNWSQPTATVLACFCAFQAPSICHRLPLVAPARLHKRSILFAQIRGEKTDLGALEPRQNA